MNAIHLFTKHLSHTSELPSFVLKKLKRFLTETVSSETQGDAIKLTWEDGWSLSISSLSAVEAEAQALSDGFIHDKDESLKQSTCKLIISYTLDEDMMHLNDIMYITEILHIFLHGDCVIYDDTAMEFIKLYGAEETPNYTLEENILGGHPLTQSFIIHSKNNGKIKGRVDINGDGSWRVWVTASSINNHWPEDDAIQGAKLGHKRGQDYAQQVWHHVRTSKDHP
jgi:hypothetical protein